MNRTPASDKSGSGALRAASNVALALGAPVSIGLMFITGRGQRSQLLLILFVGWVLAPFIGAALAARFARNWPARSRALLDVLMIALAVGSLAGYFRDYLHPASKAAFAYVMVPAASWVLILIVFAVAAAVARRRQST